MENKRFLTAQDVMEMLGVSLSYSYKLIRRLNAELEADGFVTIKGRVSTRNGSSVPSFWIVALVIG